MAAMTKRISRFLDRAVQDIRYGVIAGFDRLWYG